MNRDWARLGRAIKARREQLGMTTQQALADAAGVTRQTVQALEAGRVRSRMPAAMAAIERALQWEPGEASRILTGADEAAERYAEGMPSRVRRELSDGEVVDTEVVDLGVPGSGSRLVVVFKRDSPAADMDPAELQRQVEEWTRIQRAMRDIAAPPEGNSR
ncbi:MULTISPECIES: helix-turn-helix transcriptional regulator [Streptomyces]|nr:MULTISPECIES: helix-turn-helix transcriptional regulator [Streptomyces]UUS30875.1 helix-turn-helix domain-containing protein [Streptomyces changanensis]